jgi:hypothetical protein
MADHASNGASRFFQKIYDSAHAGLMDEAPHAQRFSFEAAVPVHSLPMILGDDLPAPAGLEDAVGPIAKDAKSDYFQTTSAPMTNAERRGEEGPLSGGFSGLNKKSVDFGESSFSRSGADAVGSASESSYDTHVGSMKHTEVGHASGHELSSSIDRIKSGVSKPPESNPVLFLGSRVERSVDVKDRRQQAALSHDHGKRGIGPGGLDNDRAGLPPPPTSPLDTTQPTAAIVKAGDAAEIETASATPKGQTASLSEPVNRSPEKRRPTAIDTGAMKSSDDHQASALTAGHKGANRFNRPPPSFSDPAPSQQGRSTQIPRPAGNAQAGPAAAEDTEKGNRSSEKRRPTAIDTGAMKISDDHQAGAAPPGHKGANRFNRPPSGLSDPAPSQPGSSTQIPQPACNAQGGPAAAETAESPIKTPSVTEAGADSRKLQRTDSPGTEIRPIEKTIQPQFPEADTVVNVAHTRRRSQKTPLFVHAKTDGPPMPTSPAGTQPLDRLKPQTSQQPKLSPGDPQVQIGHIDVILQTPQSVPKPGPETSSGQSGFASRYYLKGL